MRISKKALKEHLDTLATLLDAVGDEELYLVGGAVRDLLLGREVLDLDFALHGSGLETASKAAKNLKGALVPLSQEDDEARVVIRKELIFDFKGFTDSIQKDLSKRDFTINAMAVPFKELMEMESTDVIDPFGGLKDLKKGVIRKVGPSSIKDDRLRILRAYRFAAQLSFSIHPSLEKEAEQTSLEGIAAERISYELFSTLAQERAYPFINHMVVAGVLPRIFPFPLFWEDFAIRSHSLAVFDALERVLKEKSFPPYIREKIEEIYENPHRSALLKLCALFHDVSKPETRMRAADGLLHFYGHDTRGAKNMKKVLKDKLRFSKADAEYVEKVIARHMHLHLLATAPELTERAMRRFMRITGEVASDVMALDLADGFATAGRTRHLERTIEKILKLAREDAKRADFKPLVTGYDLIDMGLKPGPLFKEILAELEELQWERRIQTKEEALELVKKKLARGEYQTKSN